MASTPANASSLPKGADTSAALDAAKEKRLSLQMKGANDPASVDKAARDFEAMFLSEMLQPMFKDSNMSKALGGGGKGEEMFSGLMVEEYGKSIAKSGGIGIAAFVKKEIIKMQEAAQQGGAPSASAVEAAKAKKAKRPMTSNQAQALSKSGAVSAAPASAPPASTPIAGTASANAIDLALAPAPAPAAAPREAVSVGRISPAVVSAAYKAPVTE